MSGTKCDLPGGLCISIGAYVRLRAEKGAFRRQSALFFAENREQNP
jgi:hypothetical protein